MEKEIAIYGGSFNPPGIHHFFIGKTLERHNFKEVIILPCGPRPEAQKHALNSIEPEHRANLVRLAFQDVKSVRLELWDIWSRVFTRTHIVDAIYQHMGKLRHVIGYDLVRNGRDKQSQMHLTWENGQEIWHKLNFAIMIPKGICHHPDDLPPHSLIFDVSAECAFRSSTKIRQAISAGEQFEHLVLPEIASYIKKHNLYGYRKEERR